MRVGALLTALAAVEGVKVAFLKRTKKEPIIGNAYADPMSACCACFKTKYAWPENSGMPDTTANAHTCNTCYVADRYGVEVKTAGTISVPQSSCPSTGGAEPLPTFTSTCAEYCDSAPVGGQCTFAISNAETGEVLEDRTYADEGACAKIVADEELIRSMDPSGELKSVCDIELLRQACPTACGGYGCSAGTGGGASGGASGGKYQKSVHEWNWNCADGNAPSVGNSWLSGPVDGEPAARIPYLMCSEEHEWYCHSEDSDDLKKSPDMGMPEKLSTSTCDVNYMSLLKLPGIDMSKVR